MNKKQRNQLHEVLVSASTENLSDLIVELADNHKDIYQEILKFEILQGKSEFADDYAKEIWKKVLSLLKRYGKKGYLKEIEYDLVSAGLFEILDISSKLTSKFRLKIFEGLFSYKESSKYQALGLDEWLSGICESKDDYLKLAEFYQNSKDGGDKNIAIRIVQEYGTEGAYLKLRKENLKSCEDFADLARHYHEKWDDDLAKKYAWEGWDIEGDKSSCVEILAEILLDQEESSELEQLINRCKKIEKYVDIILEMRAEKSLMNKDYEASKKDLLDALPYKNLETIPYYIEHLRTNLKEKDYLDLRPKLIEKVKDFGYSEFYLYFLQEEGLKEELKTFIMNFYPWKQEKLWYREDSNVDLEEYAVGIQELYPNEMIEYFLRLVHRQIAVEGTIYYDVSYAINYLLHVKEIYLQVLKDKRGWVTLVESLKKKYGRKGNVIYLLNRLNDEG